MPGANLLVKVSESGSKTSPRSTLQWFAYTRLKRQNPIVGLEIAKITSDRGPKFFFQMQSKI